jgi:hypothetical protein
MFVVERFNTRKVKAMEGTGKHLTDVPNRYAGLENTDNNMTMGRA